jgi:hypothetical protein
MTPTDTSQLNGATGSDECLKKNVPPMKRMRLVQNKDDTNDSFINSLRETKYIAPLQQHAAGAGVQQHPKLRANRFLRMHLVLLKALYAEEDDPSNTPCKEDNKVEEDDWICVDEFLRDRDRIQAIGSMVEQMGSVYSEAMKLQHTVAGQDPTLSMTVTVPITATTSPTIRGGRSTVTSGRLTPSNLMYRSSSLLIITQASAGRGVSSPQHTQASRYHHHYHMYDRTHPRAFLRTSTTPIHNRFYRHPEGNAIQNGSRHYRGTDREGLDEVGCNAEEESLGGGENALGIVSGLLKRKHQIARKHLNKKSAPYRSLLWNVQSRIQNLEEKLHDQAKLVELENGVDHDRFGSSDWIAAKERIDESIARMETKMKLWRVLWHELKATTK